jgi:hypothetical protein
MANHGRPLKMFTDKDEDWPIWEIDFEGRGNFQDYKLTSLDFKPTSFDYKLTSSDYIMHKASMHIHYLKV